jgi:transposase
VPVHDCSSSMAVVAVDVGKNTVALSVTDDRRHRLFGPIDFAMTRAGLSSTLGRIHAVLPPQVAVKVGIEAAGHYHQPLMVPASWPAGWCLLELNPAHVTEQRRVQGRRGVKTDAIDLEAIAELVLTGRGSLVTNRAEVIGRLQAWSGHRTRRVATRTATKNQLLGQLDRSFPGLTLALPDVLGTKVGRLVATHFADPTRLTALGSARFVRFAAARNVQVRQPIADRLLAAARDALPTADAAVARAVLAADLALLAVLDEQVAAAERELAAVLPDSPYEALTSVPGWATVRVGTTAPPSGTHTGGQDPDRSIAPRGSLRCSTSPQASAATGRSAARAASNCAAP